MPELKKRRHTPQRMVVLEELKKLTTHPTATDLYEIVRKRMPSISLGTVYRNLELLSRLGMIQKLEFGGPETRYDADTSGHTHVQCLECGRVGDLHGLTAEMPIELPREQDGFTIFGYRIIFFGLCARCKSNGASITTKKYQPLIEKRSQRC